MLISDFKSEILPLRAAAEQFRAIFRLAAQTACGLLRRKSAIARRSPAFAGACVLLYASALSVVACLTSLTRHLSSGSVFAAGGLYEVREIKPHVFVWIPEDVIEQQGDPRFSRAATAGFVVTTEGVVVVDTTNSPFHGRELLYEIHRQTDAPVKYVIDTNSRGDHMLGNEVFVDQQAVIVSTTAAQGTMRRYRQELARRLEEDWRLPLRMRGFHPTLPNQTFEGELGLRLGSQEIRLLGANYPNSTGDLMVYLPAAKVLFLGELFQNGYFPSVDGRDLSGWIETLDQVEHWPVDAYVPGHGAPGGRKELVEFRDFLTWLTNQVQSRIKEGKSLDQVKNELGALENYNWRAPELAPAAVEAVYQQLKGSAPRSEPPKASNR